MQFLDTCYKINQRNMSVLIYANVPDKVVLLFRNYLTPTN